MAMDGDTHLNHSESPRGTFSAVPSSWELQSGVSSGFSSVGLSDIRMIAVQGRACATISSTDAQIEQRQWNRRWLSVVFESSQWRAQAGYRMTKSKCEKSGCEAQTSGVGSGVGEVKFARRGKKTMRRREKGWFAFSISNFRPPKSGRRQAASGLARAIIPVRGQRFSTHKRLAAPAVCHCVAKYLQSLCQQSPTRFVHICRAPPMPGEEFESVLGQGTSARYSFPRLTSINAVTVFYTVLIAFIFIFNLPYATITSGRTYTLTWQYFFLIYKSFYSILASRISSLSLNLSTSATGKNPSSWATSQSPRPAPSSSSIAKNEA